MKLKSGYMEFKRKSFLKYGRSILLLTATLFLCGCLTPEEKIKKIVDKLPTNSKVLYKGLEGDENLLITCSPINDTLQIVQAFDLKESNADTLFKITRKEIELFEIFPTGKEFISVIREQRSDAKYHYLYTILIVSKDEETSKSLFHTLKVADDKNDLASSSYVIDKDKELITLTSYDLSNTSGIIYHTVYDFKGNKILSDPAIWNPRSSESSAPAVYLWQCNYCGEKRSSPKRPPFWEFSCYGRGENPGFGSSHDWVKISKIE